MCSLNGKHIPNYHYFFSLLWTSTFNILYIFMNVKEKVLQGFQIHSLKTGPHPCHKAGNNFWLKIWQRRDNSRGKLLACSLSEGDLGLWVAGQSLSPVHRFQVLGLSERIKPMKTESFKNKADGQVRKAHYATIQHGLFK